MEFATLFKRVKLLVGVKITRLQTLPMMIRLTRKAVIRIVRQLLIRHARLVSSLQLSLKNKRTALIRLSRLPEKAITALTA